METFFQLNKEQTFATEKAEMGKLFLTHSLVEQMELMGRKYAFLCTTGIGCIQFFDKKATTVHRYGRYILCVETLPFAISTLLMF